MSKTLLFMGDSITDCGRITCGGAGYPTNLFGPGYPGIIASKLLGEQPEKDWTIYNRAISGNRIVDLYARWKADAINLEPDILSILIGVNDSWHEANGNGVEVPRFDMFYRMLLDWTKKERPDIKFIIMEPYILNVDGRPAEPWGADMPERRAAVRKIAEDYNAIFIPLQSIFDEACKRAPATYWSPDGVHLNPAGHQIITNAWLEYAGSLL